MSKSKDRRQAAVLYESVSTIAQGSRGAEDRSPGSPAFRTSHESTPISDDILAGSRELSPVLEPLASRRQELFKMKKFRFQLLNRWMIEHLEPCRVADIGGGKGLLTYLLRQSGWPATVIDHVPQALPTKYKDLMTGRQTPIAATEHVPRIDQVFQSEMARDFDLLVAMHAHACNIQLIDAVAEFNRSFIILPCCVIDEPIHPPAGTHWLQCVVDYAVRQGFRVEPFRLNFKGQNIGLYAPAD